jgi:hypothetical protein
LVVLTVVQRRRGAWLAASLTLPVLAGYAFLELRGARLGTNASYDAYKLFFVFLPVMLPVFCGWAWLRMGPVVMVVALAGSAVATTKFVRELSAPPLIVDGELRDALSDRESAAMIGRTASGACARADGFARQPIVRMTNVSIEPGTAGSLADLIADTEEGLYLESNRSWSIDDRRLQFQFATEVAREIRGGELGRLYRNPVYSGVTPRFWGGLDAVCGPEAWTLWGLTNCGKGEPGQVMAVSHGAAPARFRGVAVRAASSPSGSDAVGGSSPAARYRREDDK